jgi:ABC-2 type transport system ATP-binding protein
MMSSIIRIVFEITVKNISKQYNSFQAVKNLSFNIQHGEIFGIAGPNGAGKTTTLKMLAGLIKPTTGSITIKNMNYQQHSSKIKQHIGYLPEENTLYENMTPHQYLRFFADLYNLPKDTTEERINHLFNELKLNPETKKIGDLSKGMQRKVAIARTLLHDPDILILDELTSGLDPVTSKHLTNHIKHLAGKKTIIFSAHNLYQVEDLCDHILIMNRGEATAQGTLRQLKHQQNTPQYTITFTTSKTPPFNTTKNNNIYTTTTDKTQLNHTLQWLAQNATIHHIQTREQTLEDIFLKLVTQNPAQPQTTIPAPESN